MAFFVVFALSGNVLTDYLSLLKSRYVLGHMSRAPTAGRLLASLLLDVVATVVLFTVGVSLFYPLAYSLSRYGRPDFLIFAREQGVLGHLVGTFEELESGMTLYAPVPFSGSFPEVPQPVYVYAAFFTTIWCLLFVLAWGGLRLVRRLGALWSTAKSRWLDVEGQPFQSMATMVIVLVTLVYAIGGTLSLLD